MKPKLLSAGMVVVRWIGGEPSYLLLRAYNFWDFPKGQAEPGEDLLQTAQREVKEETSLAELNMRWGPTCRETPVYGKGKVARYYLAECREGEVLLPVNPELGRPEHHEYKWLPYHEARRRLVDRLKPILDWAHGRVAGEVQA